MIHDLKPFPAYKDSGVPWLKEIPESWRVVRNGGLFVQRNETGFGELPILEVSLNTGVRVRSLDGGSRKQIMSDRDKYKRARAGDLAYNMMRMWQGAIGIAPVDGLVSPAYVVARPFPNVEAGYFAYLFRTDAYMSEVDKFSHGIVKDRNRLYWEEFKQIPSPVPPREEQSAITRFLEHADRRIRRCIRAKMKLVALLSEQKQAIIHGAVTRGLDPSIRLKPSGVDCLEDVPEHWELVRVKTLLRRIDQGVSPQAEARLAETGSWGVLKSGCVNRGIFREREHKRLPDGFPVDETLAVREGDVLVSRASGSPALVGSVGRVGRLQYRLILSDKTFRLQFKEARLVEFVIAAMNTRYYRTQVEQAISGAEGLANNLPLSSLRDFRLVVPRPDEAQVIAESLRPQVDVLAAAVERMEREIDFIREYRARLIADVVTGRLDVREAASSLPAQCEEAEPGEGADTFAAGDEGAEDAEIVAATEEPEA